MVEDERKMRRYQCGRCRRKVEWLSSCPLPSFTWSFLLKLSNQISWECAIKYFTGDLDLGILGFDHANGRVVPRRSVGVPDCVAYLLSKGPKFIIGRRSVPHLRELIDALDSFKRQILCCKFFEGQLHGDGSSTSSTLQWSGLMLPSTWQPPSHPEIVHLLDKMRLDMMASFAATAAQFHTFSNLDAIDRMGLRWLKDNDFVVVKDDKGSSLIPQRRTFKESVRIALATDIDQFEASKPDACAVHLAVENIVPKLGLPGRVAGLLTWQKAFEEWPIHDIEYTWKSHKQVQTARCITPTTRSPLTPLAKVVQRRLKPVVANKAQIVTCTRDVVAALDGLPVPSDVWLGTGDIKDFYPSTCPTQACEVIRNELLDFEGPSQRAAINALVAAMSLVLSNQYVRANGQIFRCRRIGQGLACASEICDLVASRTVDQHPQVVALLQECAQWYGRFRDDCLVIWIGPPDRRLAFEEAYNQANPRYVSKWEWSQSCVSFLDLSIAVHDGKLRIRTHFKASNLFRYIPPWSSHAPTVFSSWIQGEMQRYIITNSTVEDFCEVRSAFLERLCACGYQRSFVMQVFESEKCQYARRPQLLAAQCKNRQRCVPFCVRYLPFFECMRIRSVLRRWQAKIQPILASSPRLVVAYKRGQHLLHTLRNGA